MFIFRPFRIFRRQVRRAWRRPLLVAPMRPRRMAARRMMRRRF
ncbi:MAG: hypothetical protein WA009_02380 [Phototrophicaceae bacterium]|jgi:hypothetical protein|nr:hypothetical protein [Chloroflexota bacterium]